MRSEDRCTELLVGIYRWSPLSVAGPVGGAYLIDLGHAESCSSLRPTRAASHPNEGAWGAIQPHLTHLPRDELCPRRVVFYGTVAPNETAYIHPWLTPWFSTRLSGASALRH